MLRRWVMTALSLGIAASACQWIAGIGSSAIEPAEAGADVSPAPAPDTGMAAGGCGVEVHDFCDDFDDDGGLMAKWSRIDRTDSGVVEIDESFARSAPRSLKTQLPASTSGELQAAAVQIFTRAWSPMTLDFDLFLRDYPTSNFNTVALASVYFGSSDGGKVSFFLFLFPQFLQITYGPNSYQDYVRSKIGLPTNQWVHIHIQLSPLGSAAFFDLTTDLPNAPHPFLHADLPPEADSGRNPSVELDMGLQRFNPSTPDLVVHYDNVKLDFLR